MRFFFLSSVISVPKHDNGGNRREWSIKRCPSCCRWTYVVVLANYLENEEQVMSTVECHVITVQKSHQYHLVSGNIESRFASNAYQFPSAAVLEG